MKQINYKSDFDFYLILRSCDGTEIGWPEYDWTAKFYTSTKVNAFVASCIGGECVNCYNDGGRIHVVADNHHLSPGTLKVEFIAELPNGDYPDTSERIVTPEPLGIELVRTAAPCPSTVEVELVLPYLQPFVDLTEIREDIAGIKQELTYSSVLRVFATTSDGHPEVIVSLPVINVPVPPYRDPNASSGYGYGDYGAIAMIGEWD